jgi:hypothetical protein
MFSPASRWALSWSVVFGLCQQVPAGGQIVTFQPANVPSMEPINPHIRRALNPQAPFEIT